MELVIHVYDEKALNGGNKLRHNLRKVTVTAVDCAPFLVWVTNSLPISYEFFGDMGSSSIVFCACERTHAYVCPCVCAGVCVCVRRVCSCIGLYDGSVVVLAFGLCGCHTYYVKKINSAITTGNHGLSAFGVYSRSCLLSIQVFNFLIYQFMEASLLHFLHLISLRCDTLKNLDFYRACLVVIRTFAMKYSWQGLFRISFLKRVIAILFNFYLLSMDAEQDKNVTTDLTKMSTTCWFCFHHSCRMLVASWITWEDNC